MHQPSSAEFNQYKLHPALRCALATLDTQLEDELARYRRYRAGMRVAPSSTNLPKAIEAAPVKVPKKGGLDLPFIFTPPEETGVDRLAAEDVDRLAAEDIAVDTLQPGDSLAIWQGEAQAEETQYQDIGADMPQDYLESSEELLRSLAQEEAGESIERNILDNLLTPLGVGSLLLMLMGSAMFGYLVMNPASLAAAGRWAQKVASIRLPGSGQQIAAVGTADNAGSGEQGWNSSSPALDSQEFVDLSLNNFSAIRATPGGSMPILSKLTPKQQAAKNGAVNPLKQLVKDKLLPLVGVKGLGVGPIFPQAPNVGVANLPAPRGFEPPQVSLPQVSVAPRRQDYSNLPAARSYAPSPRYEAPAPRYEAPAPRYEAPRQAPRYEAPVVNLPPAPPPMLPPVPIEQPAASPSPQGDYRVVQPYTNDGDLEAAQKTNPEASFRNLDDGAYVQHGGSYSSKSEADAAAAALKAKGIEAEVK
jgi:hypothetical protein